VATALPTRPCLRHPAEARLSLVRDRRLRMGEESASEVPWGDGLETGDWESWMEGTLDRIL
jgi:hypothetical protein